MTKPPESLTDQVRRALNDYTATHIETRYAIAQAMGVPDSALSRFASGERGLSSANLDKLAKHLGLKLAE